MEENQIDAGGSQEPETPLPPETGPQPSAAPPIPGQAAPTPTPEPSPAKPKPTKFQRFIRKALLWLIIIALAFLAGIIVMQQIRVAPAEDRLAVVETELERLSPLGEENVKLAAELEIASGHLGLMQVLVDINAAQMAIANDDFQIAKAALENTDKHLAAVIPLIEAYDETLAATLPQRLSLIQSNIGADNDTAVVDIELLVRDLLKVEADLFN